MTDKPRFSLKIKSIALTLVLAFVCQDLLWAHPGLLPSANPFPADIRPPSIPVSIATVQDTFKADSGKTLYLIQDAHTNESAQRNIAKTLEILIEKEKITHVFLEAGWGDVSLSHLRDKAPLKTRRKVAGDFLREGVLSGAEYLDLTSDKTLNLWGVEDEALYWKSIEVYKEVSQGRERFRDYLKRIEQTLESLKPRVYNPSLLLFDQKREFYLDEQISYAEYLEELSSRAQSKGITLEYYPNLASLKEILRQEASIDFNRANREQLRALQSFSPEDLNSMASDRRQNGFQPFKLGSRERREEKGFYALLKDRVRNLQDYPELSKYLAYLESAEKIDPVKLLEEQKALESRVYAALSQTADETELHRISEILNNLKELFNLTLTPDTFQILKTDPAAFDITALTGFLNLKIMELKHLYERAVFLEGGYEDHVRMAREFYELTLRRDEAFYQNASRRMEEEGIQKAVLISGGYHLPNLTSLLQRKNVSYVTLTPQVLQETNQKRYEALLLGQEPGIADTGRSAQSDTIGIRPIRLNAPQYERLNERLESVAPKPAGARLANKERPRLEGKNIYGWVTRRRFLGATAAAISGGSLWYSLRSNTPKPINTEGLPAEERITANFQYLLDNFWVIKKASEQSLVRVLSADDLENLKEIFRWALRERPFQKDDRKNIILTASVYENGKREIRYNPAVISKFEDLQLQETLLHESIHFLERQIRNRMERRRLYRSLPPSFAQVLGSDTHRNSVKRVLALAMENEFEAMLMQMLYIQAVGVDLRKYQDRIIASSDLPIIQYSYKVMRNTIQKDGTVHPSLVVQSQYNHQFETGTITQLNLRPILDQIFRYEFRRRPSQPIGRDEYEDWIVDIYRKFNPRVMPVDAPKKSGARLAKGHIKPISKEEAQDLVDEIGNRWALAGKEPFGRRLQSPAYEYLLGEKGILETVDSVFRKGDFPMPKRYLAVYLAALKASGAYDLGPDSRDFLLSFLATWMRDDEIYNHVKLFASRFGYTGNRNYLRMMGKIFRTARREVSLIESEPDRFEPAEHYFDYERVARFYFENKAFVRVLFRRKNAVLTPEEKKVLRLNVLRRRPLSLEEIHRQTGLLMSDLPGYRYTALRKAAEEAARNASLFKFDINPEKLDTEPVLKLGPFTAFGTLLVLEDLGIRTVADLLKKTSSDIYDKGVWSFQNLPVEELRARLARHSLTLKGDSSVQGARLAKTREMDAVIDLTKQKGSLNALRIFSESFLVKFEQRIAEGLSAEIALGRMDDLFANTGDRAKRIETLSYLLFGEVLPEKAFFQRLDERKKEDLYVLKNISRAIHVLLQRGRYGKGEYTFRRLLRAYQRHFQRRNRSGENPLPDLDIALMNRVLDLAEGDVPSPGSRKAVNVKIAVTDAMDETKLGFPGVLNLSDFPKGEMLEEALVKIRPHVLIVRSYTKVNEALIDRLLPDLKVIIRGGHGLDNVDVDYARLRDIEVYGTQGSEAAVAAWALRAIAAAEQDGLSYAQDAAPGSFLTIPEWTKALEKKVSKEKDPSKRALLKQKAASLFAPVGRETVESLKDKTIGIIGFGSVGRELAAAAKELGMKVLVNSPSLEKDPAPAAALGYKVVPKDTIYWLSHYIVPVTGLYKKGPRRNVGMIGKEAVDVMLRNRNLIALVNPDREGLVDEKAVAQLPEAGIQYLVDEVPDSGFLKEKARYTPHIAASTARAEDGVVKNTAELLARVYPEVEQHVRGARLALDDQKEEPFIPEGRRTPFNATEHVKGRLSVRIEKDYDARASGVNAQTTVIFIRDGATGRQDLMNIWRPLSEDASDTASKVVAALRPVKGDLTKKDTYASLYKYVKPLSLPNGARLAAESRHAENTIRKEDVLEFSLRVYDATRKTGQIALGDLVLNISVDPKTQALTIFGLGEPVFIADYKTALTGLRKDGQGSVTLSMTELRRALGQDTAAVDAELADMDTTVPVVAEIDLTGFNNENAKELVFPLLVRELNIARKLNAVFLLKGDKALVHEVLLQANAYYEGDQNFVFENDRDLPEAFRGGRRIALLAVDENSRADLQEGRHFFMKALGQADLPNFRAILKAVLYEARIDNLETTDPRFIRFIRAYDVLLGSRSIDDISGFIHVLEGRETNIAAILKYAVQPRPIPINALVRVFSLMKRMAEQAA